MSTLPTTPPTAFEAGTTVSFTQSPVTHALGEISPANGWSLVWLLRGPSSLDVDATDDGVEWTVRLDAADNDVDAGQYVSAVRATKDGAVVPLYRGSCTVTPDVLAALEGDLQSSAATLLPKVRTAIHELVEGGAQFTMIGDRQWNAIDIDKLLRLEMRLVAQLGMEKGAGSFGTPVVPTRGYIR